MYNRFFGGNYFPSVHPVIMFYFWSVKCFSEIQNRPYSRFLFYVFHVFVIGW